MENNKATDEDRARPIMAYVAELEGKVRGLQALETKWDGFTKAFEEGLRQEYKEEIAKHDEMVEVLQQKETRILGLEAELREMKEKRGGDRLFNNIMLGVLIGIVWVVLIAILKRVMGL